MLKIKSLINHDPYALEKKEKKILFKKFLTELTLHHFNKCNEYRKVINNLKFNMKKKGNKLEDFPMLPVKIFKSFDLASVKKNKIVKKIVSSGTSGQNLSKIYLDKQNANNQTKIFPFKSVPYLSIIY